MSNFGVDGTWAVMKDHRVLWGECDPYGHANHTSYLRWCEDLRCSHWLALGGRFSAEALGPVLGQMEVRYLKPLAYDDQVRVTMRPVSLRRTSWVEEYAVWKQGLVFTCRSVLVGVVGAGEQRTPLPAELRAQLVAEGAKEEG